MSKVLFLAIWLSCFMIPFNDAIGQVQSIIRAPSESGTDPSASIVWAGKGAYRLLVEVSAEDIGTRSLDIMPTELVIDLTSKLKELGLNAKADLCSLQVI